MKINLNTSAIYLSFFPVEPIGFNFSFYIKDATSEPTGQQFCRTFKNGNGRVTKHIISFQETPGFVHQTQASNVDIGLTKRYLWHVLVEKCNASLAKDAYMPNLGGKFLPKIGFKLQDFDEGSQIVALDPYYLAATCEFGFLADFEFVKLPEIAFGKRVLQLSLSLDTLGKTNKDFYLDKAAQMSKFKTLYWSSINAISSDPLLTLSDKLPLLKTSVLEPRTYLFGGENVSHVQYSGVKQFGPHKLPKGETFYYFIFGSRDRPLAVDLLKALRGEQYDRVFPGMETIFRLKFNNDTVGGQEVSEVNEASLDQIVNDLDSHPRRHQIFPIVIGPEGDTPYYPLKHKLLAKGMSSQFVTSELLRKPNALKWSVANIALQIFAKLGGQPWSVKAANRSALIVGIGQAHHTDKDTSGRFRIQRYVAYSILIDSSGNYIDLQIMADCTDPATYYKTLRESLTNIFLENGGKFTSIVLHTPFKLQRPELESIEAAVHSASEELTEQLFFVVKINDKNRFFGYDSKSNSRVPEENTWLKISDREFLVWFEGLQPDAPNITKKVPGPVHVEIIYPKTAIPLEHQIVLLQDLANLAGANWRGFNAKSVPISVQYCQRVSRFAEKFTTLGLGEISITSLKPWFL